MGRARRLLPLLLSLLVAAAPAAPVHRAPKKPKPAEERTAPAPAQPGKDAPAPKPKPKPAHDPSPTTGPLHTLVLRPVSAGECSFDFSASGSDNEDGLTVTWAPYRPSFAGCFAGPIPDFIPRPPIPADLRAGYLALPPPASPAL